jgi:hypothetical protein
MRPSSCVKATVIAAVAAAAVALGAGAAAVTSGSQQTQSPPLVGVRSGSQQTQSPPLVGLRGGGGLVSYGVVESPQVGALLSTTKGQWTNSPASFAYEWRQCDTGGAGCTDIVGATSSSYRIVGDDTGHTLRVVVTATGPGGAHTQTSDPTGVVGALPSTPNPGILTQSNITTGGTSGTGDGGNGWGVHKLTVARSSTGDLFAVYDSGADDNDKTYHLMRCTANCTASNATWTEVTSGDGGREVPLLLVAPNSNKVYLVIWNGGTPNNGVPRLVSAGVNGAGPVTTMSIPANGTPGCWGPNCVSPTNVDDSDPYASAATDTNGNVYVLESTQASAGGSNPDSGMQNNLAWTTGDPATAGNWHQVQLPAATDGDYRYSYPFVLPDNHGGVDVTAVRSVDCHNTAFMAAHGYGTMHDSAFILDEVRDWHTPSLNAGGGPTWTQVQVRRAAPASPSTACNGGFVNELEMTSDVYRDTYGNVHVLYTDSSSTQVGYHAVLGLSGGRWQETKEVTLPSGHCFNDARIAQDYSGRFYVFSMCGHASFYVWPADTTDGTTLTNPVSPSILPITNDVANWYYFAPPRGGTEADQHYLDMAYPYRSGTRIDYARVRLAN